MWYFTRKLDSKEFMLVSASIGRKYGDDLINGVAEDGEKCSLVDWEWNNLIKK